MRHFSACLAAAVLLAPVGRAQTPPNLIGLTSTNSWLIKQDQTAAGCPAARCVTGLPATPVTGQPAGGTACDANRHGVWITNGTELRFVDSNSCVDLCNPIQLAGLVGSIATGLAFHEPTDTLWIVDARSRFYRFQPLLTATGCILQGGLVCDASNVHPAGHQIAGLAVDDVTGNLYYTASNFTAAVPANFLVVAPQANPCAPVCRIPFQQCGANPLLAIRGAGYDPCRRVVWLTDGLQTAAYRVDLAQCVMQNIACCTLNLPTTDIYVGLCVRPSESTSVGASCTNPPCANCPNMRHTTSWAAIGGVLAFDLHDAPAPSQVVLALGFGPCQTPGVGLPFLCAPIRIFLGPPPPIFAGAFAVPGVGCGGQRTVRVRVPLDVALCGAPLSSQYIVGCVSGGNVGFGITNCVDTQISGS